MRRTSISPNPHFNMSISLTMNRLPIIIGMDYAGVVSAIGEAVTDFAPGDAVYGINLAGGAAAEYMLLTSGYITCIAKLPETMSFDEGASLPAPAFTAITSLFRVDRDIPGGLQGKTVLVSGRNHSSDFTCR